MQSSPIWLKVVDVTVFLTALPAALELSCLNINCVCLGPVEKRNLLHAAGVLNDLDKPSVSDRLGLRKGWRFLRQSQYHTFGIDNKQSLSGARHHVGKRPLLPSCFFLPYFSSTLLLQAYTPFINWAHSAGNTARLSSRTHLACNQ